MSSIPNFQLHSICDDPRPLAVPKADRDFRVSVLRRPRFTLWALSRTRQIRYSDCFKGHRILKVSQSRDILMMAREKVNERDCLTIEQDDARLVSILLSRRTIRRDDRTREVAAQAMRKYNQQPALDAASTASGAVVARERDVSPDGGDLQRLQRAVRRWENSSRTGRRPETVIFECLVPTSARVPHCLLRSRNSTIVPTSSCSTATDWPIPGASD